MPERLCHRYNLRVAIVWLYRFVCICVGMKNEEPFSWAMDAGRVSLLTSRARLIAPDGGA